MAKNDITGDEIKSRVTTDAYRNNPFWDNISRPKAAFVGRLWGVDVEVEGVWYEAEPATLENPSYSAYFEVYHVFHASHEIYPDDEQIKLLEEQAIEYFNNVK